MQDQKYTNSLVFLNSLFEETVQQVELRACPNLKGEAGAASLFTRDNKKFLDFCRRKDGVGMGVYFGVCTRREGAGGSAAAVMECPALWVDIDCAKQEIKGQEAIDALGFLPFAPSWIVNSGGGLHAYWQLEEPLNVSEGSEQREVAIAALKALARILAGDTSCAELARIMRLPGTHNSKDATLALYDGQPALCEVLESSGRVYDFTELCHWLSTQRPMLHGKTASPRPVNEADPFVAYAREAGYEPGIDIDATLAAMEHGSGGDNSVHKTQLRVSASMIARGYEDDEIVDRIIAATEAAAPRDRQWNWDREEREIRKMIATARGKGFDKPKERKLAPVPTTEGNLAVVHDLEEEREKRAKLKTETDKTNDIAITGEAVIGVWQDRYGPIMHANGSTWSYQAGLWEEWNDRLDHRLKMMVQDACASLKIKPTTSMLNAVYRYVMERPSLYRDDVIFDGHGLLVASDACLNFRTLEIVPHSPDHFATQKAAVALAGSKDHPTLTELLSSCFADRSEAKDIVSTLQEWFGSAIAPLLLKTRDMKKGLLVYGPSRSGKSQIAELARWLLGHKNVSGAKMRDLEDRFGVEPLIGKRGWIADDAIGEAETLDAETYKVVVTGEPTSCRRKGGKNWEGRFGIPVLLTANNMPRVKDQSEATYNRSLVLPMTNVREKGLPEPPGYESISAKIAAEELTGLLWWAIDGWRRLHARGDYAEPEIMRQAGQSFQDDNNPVGAWLKQCASVDRENKVARLDLAASFNGWRTLEHDDAKAWLSHTITRRIRQIMPHLEETKYNGERMFAGIRLNEDGLYAWQRAKDTAGFEKKITYSNEKEDVNRPHLTRPQTEEKEEKDRRPRF